VSSLSLYNLFFAARCKELLTNGKYEEDETAVGELGCRFSFDYGKYTFSLIVGQHYDSD
jgi:hypothetical protein